MGAQSGGSGGIQPLSETAFSVSFLLDIPLVRFLGTDDCSDQVLAPLLVPKKRLLQFTERCAHFLVSEPLERHAATAECLKDRDRSKLLLAKPCRFLLPCRLAGLTIRGRPMY